MAKKPMIIECPGISILDVDKAIQDITAAGRIIPYYIQLARKLDPKLEYVSVLGKHGIEGVTLKVQDENQIYALKMTKGKSFTREAEAYTALSGIQGIPLLHKEYRDTDKNVIALLKQYIEGCTLVKYGSAGFRLTTALWRLKHEFKERGYALPLDIIPDNIIMDRNGEPHIIDLGRVKKLTEINEAERIDIRERLKSLESMFGN